jgi:hypothetical protein
MSCRSDEDGWFADATSRFTAWQIWNRFCSKPLHPIGDLPKGGRRCDDRSTKGRPQHGTHSIVRANERILTEQIDSVLGRSDRLRTARSRLAFVPPKKENFNDDSSCTYLGRA